MTMEEELNKKINELEAKTSLSLEQEKQISELTQEVQAVQKMAEEMEEEMRKKVEDSEKAKEQAEKVQEEMKKKIEDLEEAKKLVTEEELARYRVKLEIGLEKERNELDEKVTALEAKYKKAQEQIAIMQSSGGKGETGGDFLRSKCNQLESELLAKTSIIDYQEKAINDYEETISKLEEMKARIIIDSQHTEDQITKLEHENQDLKSKTQDEVFEVENLKCKTRELQRALVEKSELCLSLENECAKIAAERKIWMKNNSQPKSPNTISEIKALKEKMKEKEEECSKISAAKEHMRGNLESEINKLAKKLEAKNAESDNLKSEVEVLRNEAKQEKERINAVNEDLRSKLTAREVKLEETVKEMEKIEVLRRNLMAEIKRLTDQNLKSLAGQNDLRNLLNDKKAELATALEQIETFQADEKSLKEKLNALEVNCLGLTLWKEKMVNDFESVKKNLVMKEAEYLSLATAHAKVTEEAKGLKEKVKDFETDNSRISAENVLSETMKRLKTKETECLALVAEKKEIISEKEALKQKLGAIGGDSSSPV